MFGEVEVEAVGKGIHEFLEPSGAFGIFFFQVCRIDEELLTEILINLGFAFGFGQAAQRVQVIGFDAIEIVLGLGVDHTEYGVGVGFTEDVGDAPSVANDRDGFGLALAAL